jgi:hypothetical protein
MASMEEPLPETPERPPPTPTPGERRLAHPPSDRYRSAEPDDVSSGSAARAVAFGVLTGIGFAIAIVLLGGVLALSTSLVLLAPILGWTIAWAVKTGADGSVTRSRLALLALALAFGAVVLGQLGLWLYARTEGGVLSFTDYLGEVYGVLVPLQFLFAVPIAWATTR